MYYNAKTPRELEGERERERERLPFGVFHNFNPVFEALFATFLLLILCGIIHRQKPFGDL